MIRKSFKITTLALVLCLPFAISTDADQFQDAVAAYHEGNFAIALKLLRPLAEQGDTGAQVNLGFMYATGKGTPQDYTEAMKWFRKAADQGYADGQRGLGFMYDNGEGVPQDYAEAMEWFRKAADQGDAEAEKLYRLAESELQQSNAASTETNNFFVNHDLPGNDYETIRNASLEACREACNEDAKCKAFTFDINANWCFLKSAASSLVASPNAVSWLKIGSQREQASNVQQENPEITSGIKSAPTEQSDDQGCYRKVEIDKPEDLLEMLTPQTTTKESAAPQQNYTVFRNISLGMREADIAKLAPNQMTVKNCKFMHKDVPCGSYTLGEDGRVRSLRLYACFFNAENMTLKDFAQAILDHYGADRLTPAFRSFGNISYTCYEGTTSNNEALAICEFPTWSRLGDIQDPRIGLKIDAPNAAGGAAFNNFENTSMPPQSNAEEATGSKGTVTKNMDDKQKEEKQAQDFANLVNDLARQQAAPDTKEKTEPTAQSPVGPFVIHGPPMTASENDAIRSQILPCWEFDARVTQPEKYTVVVRITVREDGAVTGAQVEDMSRMGDPTYRSVAESAIRAVENPACVPLKLPVGKYWPQMDIVFDLARAINGGY
jgi:hypothetical protein